MLKHKQELPVKCQGINSTKVVVDGDEECIKFARLACGNAIPQIGSIINIASNMYIVRSQFPEGTREYEELTNRLIQMQKISQSVIDAKKSGVYFETPPYWYKSDLKHFEHMTDEEREFNLRIVADKKPYFFRYNYEKVEKNYKEFLYTLNLKTVAHWGITASDFLDLDDYTEEQKMLLKYLANKCQVNIQDRSTMYKISKKAEQMLSDISYDKDKTDIRSILKTGKYVTENHKQIITEFEKIMSWYTASVQKIYTTKTVLNKEEKEKIVLDQLEELKLETLHKLLMATDFDEELACDILIEVTQNKETVLLWELFGTVIINNLLKKNNYKVNVVLEDENGMHSFRGKYFTLKTVEIEAE